MIAVTSSAWMLFFRGCPSFNCWIVNEWNFCGFNLCFVVLLISLSRKEFIPCSWAHCKKHNFLSLPQNMHRQGRDRRKTNHFSLPDLKKSSSSEQQCHCLVYIPAEQVQAGHRPRCVYQGTAVHTEKLLQKLKLCQRETQGSFHSIWGGD